MKPLLYRHLVNNHFLKLSKAIIQENSQKILKQLMTTELTKFQAGP